MKKISRSGFGILSNYIYLIKKLHSYDRRLYGICFAMVLVGLGIPLSNVFLPKLLNLLYGWNKQFHPESFHNKSSLLICFDSPLVRACLGSQRVRISERILCPARQKFAVILTDYKDF